MTYIIKESEDRSATFYFKMPLLEATSTQKCQYSQENLFIKKF